MNHTIMMQAVSDVDYWTEGQPFSNDWVYGYASTDDILVERNAS